MEAAIHFPSDEVKGKSGRDLILRLIMPMTQSFYMGRTIDLFLDLPEVHQNGLVQFLAAHVENDNLKPFLAKNQYVEVLKGVMLLYSGREKLNELTVDDLKRLICDYVNSSEFKQAEDQISLTKKTGDAADFRARLEVV